MKSPFPGMDPYLEAHWGDVHTSLILYARDQIQEQLPDPLLARAEERVVLESPDSRLRSMYPDVRVVEFPNFSNGGGTAVAVAKELEPAEMPVILELANEPITERHIEIIDAGSGNRVLTIIEFLSLTNKTPGEGQDLYLKKQRDALDAKVSLVEIDLLRAGNRILSVPTSQLPSELRTLYQVCVHRAWQPTRAEIYPVPLNRPLPRLNIPLRETDHDVVLNLQGLIELAYRNGRYARTIDYRQPPEPPLEGPELAWAQELLRTAGKI